MMQKIIYLFIFLFVMMFCTNNANAQCSGGTSGGYIYPTTAWKSVNTNPINGASYRTFPAITGATYYFSFCTADGGSSIYDTHIMLLNNAGAAIGVSNDDFCGFRSYLTWNCPTTGFYRVLVTKFFCTTQPNMGTMVYKSSVNGPLPIDLVSFTAKFKKGYAVLKWTTETETNSDYFIVEKQNKVNHEFVKIGNIKAQGLSSNISNYSFVDYNTSAGINYYRLNMIDKNGDSQYSDIVEVNASEEQMLCHLCVNQNEKKLHLTFYNDEPQSATIYIYNINGQEVSSIKFNIGTDEQHFEQSISHLTSNIYFIKIETEQNEFYYQKIIVADN